MSRASAFLLAVLLPGGVAAQAEAPVTFERDVLPILTDSCVRCHKAPYRDERGRLRKPKADLRLDGAFWIRAGSKDGPVVIAGAPDRSPLYTLTVLPEDDSDRMPKRGDPLPHASTEILRRWIALGADFGGWQGEPGPAVEAAAAPPRVTLLQRLGKGLAPAKPAAVIAAAGDVAQIRPVVAGSPLLRVEFFSNQGRVGAAEIAALGALSANVAYLHAGRTALDDKALAIAGRMPRLVRLDLHGTAVTDNGLRHLGKLKELRYLNLHDTAITDRGLEQLAQLENLEAVYLWRTKVTDKGVAALQRRLPKARIHHVLKLPEPVVEPADDDEESRGRKRRKKKAA